MNENVIRTKSCKLAIRIVKLYQYLGNDKREFVISKQVLRSGTSVGALIYICAWWARLSKACQGIRAREIEWIGCRDRSVQRTERSSSEADAQ